MIIIVNPDDTKAAPVKVSEKVASFVKKKMEDKRLIREYITQGKDLSQLSNSRGIEFVKAI